VDVGPGNTISLVGKTPEVRATSQQCEPWPALALRGGAPLAATQERELRASVRRAQTARQAQADGELAAAVDG
jgi:hypothetical protein